MRPLLAALAFLLLASPAWGGGFATTGLGSLPDGKAAGEPWLADVELLGHGRTPWSRAGDIAVVIQKGSVTRRFATREIRPGVYRARVVFPDAGRWRYSVDAGYVQEHFAPVTIAEPAPPAADASGGGTPRWPLALGAGLLAALATALVLRGPPRRRLSPAT
jgi:hypothetical protein